MSELIRLLDNAVTFDKGREQAGYSKVILNVTEDLYYEAGTDTGETLEVDCPWGTQAICNSILENIRGYAYKPYTATDAILDPAAEIGDSVNIKGVQSGIFDVSTEFNPLMTANISAPPQEDIDSEYPYKPSSDRKITRRLANVESEIRQQADEISAKVSETGGDVSQSFSWSLTKDGFILANNGSEVFRADASGITVKGEIHATSGFIGSDSNGFAITANSIYNGIGSYSSTGSGVYIGTDGINIGGKFKVDSGGNISAASATFDGRVNASNIRYGSGSGGYFNGGGITSGSIGSGSSGALSSGVRTSLGHGDSAFATLNAGKVDTWVVSNLTASKKFTFLSKSCGWQPITIDGVRRTFLVAE